MVGLLDIAPPFRSVPVNGEDVRVTGVSAHGIAYLFQKFPQIRALLAQRAELTLEEFIELVPEAIAAIIACGCGCVGSPEAEAMAAKLGAETQMDFLQAIAEVTMPKGVGPFFERLVGMANSVGASSAKIPDMKLQPPSKS